MTWNANVQEDALFPDDPLSLMIGGPDYSMRENGFDGFREVSHTYKLLSLMSSDGLI